MDLNAKVRTCFWFDDNGHEAVDFWVSLLPDSAVENVVPGSRPGVPQVVEFMLGGVPMMILNGGPMFQPNEAASISVLTDDQAETDRLWAALTAGGSESMCGWLKDRYGVSWQIVPRVLPQLLASEDRAAAGRVMAAMLQMKRIDISTLTVAAKG